MSYELKQQFFNKSFFSGSKPLTIVAQMAKYTGFLPYSLVKYIIVDLTGVNIITYGKSPGVPSNIFSSVYKYVHVAHRKML